MQRVREVCTHEPFLDNLLEDEFYPRDDLRKSLERNDDEHVVHLIGDVQFLKGSGTRVKNNL